MVGLQKVGLHIRIIKNDNEIFKLWAEFPLECLHQTLQITNDWFKSNNNAIKSGGSQVGGFCLVVVLAWGRSVTNRATSSSLI